MVNAMIEAFVDIGEADLNGLGRAIDLMMVHTNRSLAQAVDRAALTFLKSAKARTVKAKGMNRKQHGSSAVARQQLLVPSMRKMYTKRQAADKYYRVYEQGVSKPIFVRIPDVTTGTKKQKASAKIRKQKVIRHFERKPRVGAAKASWSRAFSDIGKPTKAEMLTRNVKVMASSRAKRMGTKFQPTINIVNKLSYLLKTSPDLERQAMVAAGKSLLFKVNNRIEAQIKTWR